MKNTFIKISLSLCLILLATALFANETQDSQTVAQYSWINWVYENMILLIGGLIALGAVLGIIRLNGQLLELQKIRLLEEHGIETMEKLALTPKGSALERWLKNMTKAVPVEKEEDVMLDHDYDGIRELDNILPPWWVSLFKITIVMGVVYFGYYHLTDYGLSSAEEWEMEMAEGEESVKAYLATQPDLIDENTVTALSGELELTQGKTIYMTNCFPCHGEKGEGTIGPNLTDKYWIHGGDIKDIFRVVKYGANNGMMPWKAQLSADEMQKVSSYILSLKGTDPPNAKAPEGDLYTPKGE